MSTNALRLLLGRVVDGRYLLDEWLGGGSFGGVFLAGEYVDDRRLRTVAVKLLPAEPGDAGDAQRRELEVSLNLDHPNLLRCFSAGRCGVEGFDVLYLTMEVAEGSLEARLQESRLSESETRELALSLASALSHLHAKNLVHRDVKPGNVLRVGDAWKLADFGLVRGFSGTQVSASGMKGTALYMSPEAVQGQTGPHVDVWALGVVLQQAASGVLAYSGGSEAELIAGLLTKEPTIAAGLPEWLDALVRRCLARDRAVRPSSGELASILAMYKSASAGPSVLTFPRHSIEPQARLSLSRARLARTLKGHKGWVESVAYSPDGRTIASGSMDTSVHLWNADNGANLGILTGHFGCVESVVFSPDGQTVASCGGDDGTVCLWDSTSGELLERLESHEFSIYDVAFSPDGLAIVSGGGDGKIRLARFSTRGTTETLPGHLGVVWTVAFSPDGRTIASGSSDMTIRLWDASTFDHLYTFEGHCDSVRSVAFSPRWPLHCQWQP